MQVLAHRKISLRAYVQVLLYTLSSLNLKSFFEQNKIFVCDSDKMKKKKKICVHRLHLHTNTHSAQDRVLTGTVIFKKDASLKYFPEDNFSPLKNNFCFLDLCILLSC